MAPPEKLTDEARDLICKLIVVGNTKAISAEAAGISEATFYRWMEAKTPRHKAFQKAVAEAEAEAEASLVAMIRRAAARGSWRAGAWLLERMNPAEWASATDRKAARDEAEDADAEADPLAEFDELAQRRKSA